MKKIMLYVFTLFVALSLTVAADAQTKKKEVKKDTGKKTETTVKEDTNSGNKNDKWTRYSSAFQKGDMAVQAGIGLISFGMYGDTVVPPISASFDWAMPIKDLPFSFGAFLGYASSEYKFYYTWTYSYLMLGARAAYHVDFGVKNLDTYAGVLLGYNIVSFDSDVPSGYNYYTEGASYFLYGGFVGGRYFFTKNFAAFAEFGYGIALINVGVTFKF
jgi:hypothetical protein